jgi:glycosidase
MKYFLTVFFLIVSLGASAQLVKTEPPFWYSGMKHHNLQIMFYGPGIASYEPEVAGATINNILRTENPNYIFITVDTKGVAPGQINFEFKSGNQTVFSKDYELKKRKKGAALRQGFDSSDVIYLLMPDRFANGNSTNDSHPSMTEKVNRSFDGGRHGGDIQGIIDRLDYIESLGATAIWSTPLLEDNDPEYSYHTYAQSDVYRIDPRYGTNEDYKRLGEELHKRDMKLIMDYVTNHWGAQHWMLKDLPNYDWIHQFPGYDNTNHRMTTQFDSNAAIKDYKQCMNGWFVETMPDLNQSNPLVLNYLIQNAIWWIEYADLDGLRVDTYSYNDKEGIAKWTKAVSDEYPYINIVGEVWLHNQAQISYWQKNSPISAIQHYNTYLPSVMDFTLHDAIMEAFKENNQSWNKGIVRIYDNFVNDFLYPDINNILIFAENHDTQRINELYPDFEDYKLIMTLLATSRGIPQLYYGSEIGMKGDKQKGDGDIRRDFPGGWKEDKTNAFTSTGRTEEQKAYFNFTSRLFNWRKTAEVIHNGKMMHFAPENNVYVYFRYNDHKTVMVILNNNKEEQQVSLDRFQERVPLKSIGKEVLTNKTFRLENKLKIDGKSALILEIN